MKLANYCIPRRHRLLHQTIKQPLSNFEPWKPWKYKQLSGLRPDPSCLLIQGSVRVNSITVIAIFEAGFRDFDQNQLSIQYFKPLAGTGTCKFYQRESGVWRKNWQYFGMYQPNLSWSFVKAKVTLHLKVGLSPSKNKMCYLLYWKPFKDHEKCFLFHIKSSFRFQDI